LSLFQPTNAQIDITTVCLYIMYTNISFDISISSSGNFTFVPVQIIKIEAPKLQADKIIRQKYTCFKILLTIYYLI
jgi:hypothetical protein